LLNAEVGDVAITATTSIQSRENRLRFLREDKLDGDTDIM